MKKTDQVTTLFELYANALIDPAYSKLAQAAARNLGGKPCADLDEAMNWLMINASETSEEGVIEEVNFMLEGMSS